MYFTLKNMKKRRHLIFSSSNLIVECNNRKSKLDFLSLCFDTTLIIYSASLPTCNQNTYFLIELQIATYNYLYLIQT